MYIQYKMNSSISIHTSSYSWSVLSSDFWRTSKKYLSGQRFCLYFTLLRVRLHFPFSFHSSWGGNFNLFIFLFLKEDSLNPCIILYLHEEDLIQPSFKTLQSKLHALFYFFLFILYYFYCLLLEFTVLYFCTFAIILFMFLVLFFMQGAYCKRLICLERRETWLENQPLTEWKKGIQRDNDHFVRNWKIGKPWKVWMFVM